MVAAENYPFPAVKQQGRKTNR